MLESDSQPSVKKCVPDRISLKKALKWIFCDRAVIFFAVVGIILLLITVTIFARNVNLIRHRGMEYSAQGTVCCRLLMNLTMPALTVNTLLKTRYVITIPQKIILYSLMFAVQIIIYGVIGKVASVMSSGLTAAFSIFVGIVLLSFAIAYQVNLAQGAVIDIVKTRPGYLLLMISNMPVLYIRQHLLFVFGKTTALYFVLFPVTFLVQIFIYGLLGRLVRNMLPS